MQFCRLASYDLIYCLYTKFPSWDSLRQPLLNGANFPSSLPTFPSFPFHSSSLYPLNTITPLSPTTQRNISQSPSHSQRLLLELAPKSPERKKQKLQQRENIYFAHLKRAQSNEKQPPNHHHQQQQQLTEAGVVLVSCMYVMLRQVADFSRYMMWRNKISWVTPHQERNQLDNYFGFGLATSTAGQQHYHTITTQLKGEICSNALLFDAYFVSWLQLLAVRRDFAGQSFCEAVYAVFVDLLVLLWVKQKNVLIVSSRTGAVLLKIIINRKYQCISNVLTKKIFHKIDTWYILWINGPFKL